MPDGKPITDPETIAAYVRIARIVYGIDDVGIHFELRKRRLVFWKAILFANPRQDSQVR